jgi:hypothetical protein
MSSVTFVFGKVFADTYLLCLGYTVQMSKIKIKIYLKLKLLDCTMIFTFLRRVHITRARARVTRYARE